jgi:hypothetical protein
MLKDSKVSITKAFLEAVIKKPYAWYFLFEPINTSRNNKTSYNDPFYVYDKSNLKRPLPVNAYRVRTQT